MYLHATLPYLVYVMVELLMSGLLYVAIHFLYYVNGYGRTSLTYMREWYKDERDSSESRKKSRIYALQ